MNIGVINKPIMCRHLKTGSYLHVIHTNVTMPESSWESR